MKLCYYGIVFLSGTYALVCASKASKKDINFEKCKTIETQINAQKSVVQSKEEAIQAFFKQKSRNPTNQQECAEFKQLYDIKKSEEQKLNLLYVHKEFFERVKKKKS